MGQGHQELALVIVTFIVCVLLGYIYTIDHNTQATIFVVISGLSSFWFGRMTSPTPTNGGANGQQ